MLALGMISKRLGSLAAGACAWIASGVAFGQASGNLDVDGFRPAIDSRGFITVNASEVMGHLDICLLYTSPSPRDS